MYILLTKENVLWLYSKIFVFEVKSYLKRKILRKQRTIKQTSILKLSGAEI